MKPSEYVRVSFFFLLLIFINGGIRLDFELSFINSMERNDRNLFLIQYIYFTYFVLDRYIKKILDSTKFRFHFWEIASSLQQSSLYSFHSKI